VRHWCSRLVAEFPTTDGDTLVNSATKALSEYLPVTTRVRQVPKSPSRGSRRFRNTGTQPLKLAAVYVVERGKPLRLPSPETDPPFLGLPNKIATTCPSSSSCTGTWVKTVMDGFGRTIQTVTG
jgi:hypothetical protein